MICYTKFLAQVRVDERGLQIRGLIARKEIAWDEIEQIVGEKKTDGTLPPLMKVQVITNGGRKNTFRVGYRPGVRFLEQAHARGSKVLSDLPQFSS